MSRGAWGKGECRGKVSSVNEYLRSRKADVERFEIFNRYVKKGHMVDWFL